MPRVPPSLRGLYPMERRGVLLRQRYPGIVANRNRGLQSRLSKSCPHATLLFWQAAACNAHTHYRMAASRPTFRAVYTYDQRTRPSRGQARILPRSKNATLYTAHRSSLSTDSASHRSSFNIDPPINCRVRIHPTTSHHTGRARRRIGLPTRLVPIPTASGHPTRSILAQQCHHSSPAWREP